MLNIDFEILHNNSQKLESIIDRISLKFKDVSIYRKLTFNGNLLGGVTIDWCHLEDWNSIKGKIEEYVLRITNKALNIHYLCRHTQLIRLLTYTLLFAQKLSRMTIYVT
jgi:hypothetical protein